MFSLWLAARMAVGRLKTFVPDFQRMLAEMVATSGNLVRHNEEGMSPGGFKWHNEEGMSPAGFKWHNEEGMSPAGFKWHNEEGMSPAG